MGRVTTVNMADVITLKKSLDLRLKCEAGLPDSGRSTVSFRRGSGNGSCVAAYLRNSEESRVSGAEYTKE